MNRLLFAIILTCLSSSGLAGQQEPLEILRGHSGFIRDLEVTKDGETLISASQDSDIRVWSLQTNAFQFLLDGHEQGVNALALSSDDQRLLSGGVDLSVIEWDLDRRSIIQTIDSPARDSIQHVEYAAKGSLIFAAHADQEAFFWNATTGALDHSVIFAQNRDVLADADLAPESDLILTGSTDRTARTWNPATGMLIDTLDEHNAGVVAVEFSPSAERIATAGDALDEEVIIWTSEGDLRRRLMGHTASIQDVTWSPQGDRIATASFDDTAKVWDAATGALLLNLDHPVGVTSVCFSPSDNLLITGDQAGDIRLWDISDALSGFGQIREFLLGAAGAPSQQTQGPDGLWDVADMIAQQNDL